MKKSFLLLVSMTLAIMPTMAQNALDKKTSSHKTMRNSVCLVLMTDQSIDGKIAPILKDAFFTNEWNDKYNNHNVADALRVIDPAKNEVTAKDKADFDMACVPTSQFIELKQSGASAPAQKIWNEQTIQVTRTILAEMVKQLGEGSMDTVIRLNVARTAHKYLVDNNIANAVASKWFFDENGNYNEGSLLAERGLLNVSPDEIAAAQASKETWNQMLADKVDLTELVGNTFVAVTRYCYKEKEAVLNDYLLPFKVGVEITKMVNPQAGQLAELTYTASVKAAELAFGEGWYVVVDSYLFRLRWSPEIEESYQKCFTKVGDSMVLDKAAFDANDLLAFEFVGNERAYVNTKAKESKGLSEEGLIALAARKATDKAMAKFEAKYDQFKTKTPLVFDYATDKKGNTVPIYKTMLGTRDDLKGGEVFDVLQMKLKANKGETTKYVKVGELVVDKNNIWDNEELDINEIMNTPIDKYTLLTSKKKQVLEDLGYVLRMQNKKK